MQYLHGADPKRVAPDGYTLDLAYMARADADEIQLDLILDYRSNVALYAEFQEYFRVHQPPFLAAWVELSTRKHHGSFANLMESLTHLESRFGPRETMDRLEAEIRARDMQIFARIDHAAGAAEVGMELRLTESIIFGNARAGTPLMQMSPRRGLARGATLDEPAGCEGSSGPGVAGSFCPALGAGTRLPGTQGGPALPAATRPWPATRPTPPPRRSWPCW